MKSPGIRSLAMVYLFATLSIILFAPFSYPSVDIYETEDGGTEFRGSAAHEKAREFVYDYQNRVFGYEMNERAAKWIEGEFHDIGLEVIRQNFTAENTRGDEMPGRNVVAIDYGTESRQEGNDSGTGKVIVVMAHFDTVETTYQGADDNGCGVAAMLEIARVFSGIDQTHTIVYLAADGEEEGLLGSEHFVNNMDDIGSSGISRDQVICAVSLDMFAYENATTIEIYSYCGWINNDYAGRFQSDGWIFAMLDAIDTAYPEKGFNVSVPWENQLLARMNMESAVTDSMSFVDEGMNAFGIGDSSNNDGIFYPYYHSWRDSINRTSAQRMQLVGEFTEIFLRSLMLHEDEPELGIALSGSSGKLYFASTDRFVPAWALYLHVIAYPLLLLSQVLRYFPGLKISKETMLFAQKELGYFGVNLIILMMASAIFAFSGDYVIAFLAGLAGVAGYHIFLAMLFFYRNEDDLPHMESSETVKMIAFCGAIFSMLMLLSTISLSFFFFLLVAAPIILLHTALSGLLSKRVIPAGSHLTGSHFLRSLEAILMLPMGTIAILLFEDRIFISWGYDYFGSCFWSIIRAHLGLFSIVFMVSLLSSLKCCISPHLGVMRRYVRERRAVETSKES